MVLGRGLVFQPVLASLPYTQKCTYNSGNIITLQNILTLQGTSIIKHVFTTYLNQMIAVQSFSTHSNLSLHRLYTNWAL